VKRGLLLCVMIAAGIAAFAFFVGGGDEVVVKVERTIRQSPQEFIVFSVRNEGRRAMSVRAVDFGMPDGTLRNASVFVSNDDFEIPPHNTINVTVPLPNGAQPRLVHVYIMPAAYSGYNEAEKRTSRYPRWLRKWLMRKYESASASVSPRGGNRVTQNNAHDMRIRQRSAARGCIRSHFRSAQRLKLTQVSDHDSSTPAQASRHRGQGMAPSKTSVAKGRSPPPKILPSRMRLLVPRSGQR
jgi:hypothetical protein